MKTLPELITGQEMTLSQRRWFMGSTFAGIALGACLAIAPQVYDANEQDFGCTVTRVGTDVAQAALDAREPLGLSTKDPALRSAVIGAAIDAASGRIVHPGQPVTTCITEYPFHGNPWSVEIVIPPQPS